MTFTHPGDAPKSALRYIVGVHPIAIPLLISATSVARIFTSELMERRSVQRIIFASAARATLGNHEVRVVDVSTKGFGLTHSAALPTRRPMRLSCQIAGVEVAIVGEVVRCRLAGHGPTGDSLYHAGFIPLDRDLTSLRAAVTQMVTQQLAEERRDKQITATLVQLAS